MSWFPPAAFVSQFSDHVLAADLPELPVERREAATSFVMSRMERLPSPVKLGVTMVATGAGVAGRVVGTRRVVSALRRFPLPLVGEYVRLVRSLAYAFIWERWPSTGPAGEAR